ncbi:BTB/POZ domain-containing protein [Colletotrichum scovillei]|uniref:BTB/POZ domain-containing protein n=1 Tax=Colletotrichum scovillei TaxID=1209932 RepID=A0A9P7R1H3_9PEZI|nr:BTB/POZ domain-containing protein [Colletotrichum scovillei]KAF4780263.1 BTB/POZ domain-containing protein [Colletotrichum scovillei]KAG7046895.1 BTB/POZ domain-containing protein [Colletotrichum scovillei]KAG7056736.1 BTB/POZ domain-containing protein [Colletotrichum scovillei]KAG7066659.1 BTB/POZ domain-containing protein [Colletotrichum scovillei]
MVLRKDELEVQLKEEHELIANGVLREDNPLDQTAEFEAFLLACRRGDLKTCQELISAGVNINGKDRFDYTPLIVASLCGHLELVQLLLESGALAERNTFQGERCIYNALNDRIRNLLLEYDYSKSTDPLQPWAGHITSLLSKNVPKTTDISLIAAAQSFNMHKFLLAARTPYFRKKLDGAPDTATWKLPTTYPLESFQVALRYLYLGEVPKDVVNARSTVTEEEVLTGVDKLSKQLEIEQLWEAILAGNDRRLSRQRYEDEVKRAQVQVDRFYREKVLGHKMIVETKRVGEVKWRHDNSIFADCLLCAHEPESDEIENDAEDPDNVVHAVGIPLGLASNGDKPRKRPRKSVVYPVHKAMLIRSPYFETMFSSEFREAQDSENLHVVTVDCIPEVLEIVLTFLYTEKVDCPLELALDLLYTADILFLDKLKTKAAQAISTLGSGSSNIWADRTHRPDGEDHREEDMEPINIYDVIHAAWDLRVQRLEEFAARYLANRLEDYIDEAEFAELIKESAERLKNREETDTIELLDDIRYYLGERFRLRFEDANLEEMMDEEGEINAELAEAIAAQSEQLNEEMGENGAVPQETAPVTSAAETVQNGEDGEGVKTLGGEVAEDEFASDAINYQILLGKIDTMLDHLKLDA